MLVVLICDLVWCQNFGPDLGEDAIIQFWLAKLAYLVPHKIANLRWRKKKTDHLRTRRKRHRNSNLPFILRMVSCHCSLWVRTHPTMERSILRCTTSNLSICTFVNGRIARPKHCRGGHHRIETFQFQFQGHLLV